VDVGGWASGGALGWMCTQAGIRRGGGMDAGGCGGLCGLRV